MEIKKKYRIKRKEVEYIINLASLIHNNLLPTVKKLKYSTEKSEEPYTLAPIDFDINYPDFSNIPETDPRYLTYKIRHIFGQA